MKTIYFVRHGESEVNVSGFFRGPESPLTAKGREQSLRIAKRCQNLRIDIIISSMFTRTRQTAEIVKEKIGKEIEDSSLFGERRRPSHHYGKSWEDPEVPNEQKIIWDNFTTPNFRFSDEENFDDLSARAAKALTFLENKTEKNILVVTHNYFMRILLAKIILGEDMKARDCKSIITKFYTQNTGITVFRHDPKEKIPWWVWVWNDHAHLG